MEGNLEKLQIEIIKQNQQINQLNQELLFSSYRIELDEIGKNLEKYNEKRSQLKEQLHEIEKNMEPLKQRQFLLKLVMDLSHEKYVAVLSESDEDDFLYEIMEKKQLDLSMTTGQIVYNIRSKYTISDDCGVDSIGWDFDIDDYTLLNDNKRMVNEKEIQMSYLFGQIQEKVDDEGVEPDRKPDYDGDHHGVWAYGKMTWDVAFYKLGTGASP